MPVKQGVMAPIKRPARKFRKHYLREWREKIGLTQEQAADRIGWDRTSLGRVENMQVPYSQGLLEAAAEAYGVEVWTLLNVNPFKDGDVIDITSLLKNATPEDRAAILGFAQGRIQARRAQ